MIISGANDYEFYFMLYKLEQVNTYLDTSTQNLYTKYCNRGTAYTNCRHDENWSTFRNSELSRTVIYSFLPYALCNY